MIADLKSGQGNINVEGDIVDMGTPRSFEKFGKSGRVCTATLKDESGECKLSLWNEDCDRIKVGDHVKIVNGYCSEFQGAIQLTSGKFGKLEVVEK